MKIKSPGKITGEQMHRGIKDMRKDTGKSHSTRRVRGKVTTLGTSLIHMRNPYIVAWWSMAFPGLGHILLNKYLRGYILFIWEVIINYKSHINLALIYSFTGRFDMAKEVIDKNWVFLYLPTYLFAIWDSYRSAVDINNIFILASGEDVDIEVLTIDAVEINYLDKRIPWCSFLWSAFSPGMGHLYAHRIPAAFFILVWWVIIVDCSKLLPAIFYTFTGQFQAAKSIVNPHWLLNIPSIYLFAMYDSYLKTLEGNKLFKWEQSKYFDKEYLNKSFNILFSMKENKGDELYIFSIFEHSISLEKAIDAIRRRGIPKESILVLSMDKKNEDIQLFDSIHYSDGMSTLDLPMVLATLFAILGSIYGFVLTMGPIIWGLIGTFTGFAAGLIIKFYNLRGASKMKHSTSKSEVIVVVQCSEEELDIIKEILWKNNAIAVRKLT